MDKWFILIVMINCFIFIMLWQLLPAGYLHHSIYNMLSQETSQKRKKHFLIKVVNGFQIYPGWLKSFRSQETQQIALCHFLAAFTPPRQVLCYWLWPLLIEACLKQQQKEKLYLNRKKPRAEPCSMWRTKCHHRLEVWEDRTCTRKDKEVLLWEQLLC